MTLVEARTKAVKLWGARATAMERRPARYAGNDGKPGDPMETHLVGVRGALPGIKVYGSGFTFEDAFANAVARGYG